MMLEFCSTSAIHLNVYSESEFESDNSYSVSKSLQAEPFFSENALQHCPHTFSSQTLFIGVIYMNFTLICNTNVIMRSLNLFS